MRTMLKSKIHRAHVTETNIHYEGSITIDKTLMDEADILPYEQVQIVNINNGARFETYVIEGHPNSGEICLNGAAARLAVPGDIVIILSYSTIEEDNTHNFTPRVVHVDEKNKLANIPVKAISF